MKIQNLLAIFTYLICLNSVSILSKERHIHTRIVGGRKTDIIQLGGFLVALRVRGFFICGGSYVASRIVISAAHCVIDVMDYIDLMTVQGGISNLKEKNQQVTVQRVLIPDKYNDIVNDLDVAVILLETPLNNPKVHKIKLCDHKLKKGNTVSVYGWGVGQHGDVQPKFQIETINIPVVDRKFCKDIFQHSSPITESMICAGVPYKKDACQFDSGGPLVHRGQLCGIVSFGISCASEYPGIYSDVKYLSSWIETAIDKILA